LTTTLPRGAGALAIDEIRVEGRDKVRGSLAYTADVRRPQTLWAAFATSPFAHAKIVAIDTTAARAVPGVKAVLTGRDIGDKRHGRMLADWPILAFDKVIFIGDRVAAIAAETREAAQEAARLIDVTYEELAAVFDPRAALLSDAPILHPDGETYGFTAGQRKPRSHPNVQGTNVIVRGAEDLDAVFAGAHRVFEHSYSRSMSMSMSSPVRCISPMCSSLPTSVRSSVPSGIKDRSTAALCMASAVPSWKSCRSMRAEKSPR
jgi:CO/xanthine dehydrogenase Mo-binding subunit